MKIIENIGEISIPKNKFSLIEQALKKSKIVLNRNDKFITTKFKRLGFAIESNENFVTIKGIFKSKFYKLIL